MTKYGKEIEVGDVLVFLGTPHRVATIEDYCHESITAGETWRIARASDGWGITLAPIVPLEVA